MKKHAPSARPLLVRTTDRYLISARQFYTIGEAISIGALIVITFFHFWLGLITLLIGAALLLAGYLRSDEKRWLQTRTIIMKKLRRLPADK